MNDTATTPISRKRTTTLFGAFLAIPLLLGGLAACSAGEESAADSPKQSEQSLEDWRIAYMDCMRDEGVDIGDGTSMKIDTSDGYVYTDKVCRDRVGESPVGDVTAPTMSDAEKQAYREEMLAMAECLREAGFDVDDPDSEGRLDLPEGEISEEAFTSCAPDGGSGRGAAVKPVG